jgi:hypothetical protein
MYPEFFQVSKLFRCPDFVLGVRIFTWVSGFCVRCPDFVLGFCVRCLDFVVVGVLICFRCSDFVLLAPPGFATTPG